MLSNGLSVNQNMYCLIHDKFVSSVWCTAKCADFVISVAFPTIRTTYLYAVAVVAVVVVAVVVVIINIIIDNILVSIIALFVVVVVPVEGC